MSVSVGRQRAEADVEILAAVAEELKRGDARSAVYQQGMADVLRYRLRGVTIPRRYRAGTVEFDAYYAGNERGHVLWGKLREKVEGFDCSPSVD